MSALARLIAAINRYADGWLDGVSDFVAGGVAVIGAMAVAIGIITLISVLTGG